MIIFARRVGLFSLFLQVVGQTYLCRRRGILPVVYFNGSSLYWSDRGHNGARNVWEYYFEPVSDCGITDLVEVDIARLERSSIWEFSNRDVDPNTLASLDGPKIESIEVPPGVVVSNVFPSGVVDWQWEMPRRRRIALHEVIQRSVRLRPPISRKLEDFRAGTFEGRRVLGVHVRGIERAPERAHLVRDGILPLGLYMREIDSYVAQHPSSVVFCATDSQGALDALTERYGPKLVCYPASRLSSADEKVGLHHASTERYDRARLGEEVVIECLLLSKCDFLLHGSSNVSLAATLFNPALESLNLYQKYGYAFPRLRACLVTPRVSRLVRSARRWTARVWRALATSASRQLGGPR